MKTPIHTFLFVAAVLCFLAASLTPSFTPAPWVWHYRLIALGLFCWSLSEVVTA